MKQFNITKRLIIMASLMAGPYIMQAQINAAANPNSQSINAAVSNIPLGHTVVSTFELGNTGADPVPAGGASWTISFPEIVSVDQASLNLDGGDAIFQTSWTIFEGVTYLTLNLVGAGIPAKVFMGPQTKFTMTVNITGIAIGGPTPQTINNTFDANINQNLNTADDNAAGPISVVSALPVKLTSFTATKNGATAFINWEYSNAVNFSYFKLERSSDGIHFTDLNKKHYTPDSRGGADLKYTETDAQPLNGDNYYRLKMVDLDGSFVYSKTVKLNFVVSLALSVFPNPAKEQVRVLGADKGSKIALYDISGKMLQAFKASGNFNDEITLTGLANGQYIIKVTGGAVSGNLKVMKQ